MNIYCACFIVYHVQNRFLPGVTCRGDVYSHPVSGCDRGTPFLLFRHPFVTPVFLFMFFPILALFAFKGHTHHSAGALFPLGWWLKQSTRQRNSCATPADRGHDVQQCQSLQPGQRPVREGEQKGTETMHAYFNLFYPILLRVLKDSSFPLRPIVPFDDRRTTLRTTHGPLTIRNSVLHPTNIEKYRTVKTLCPLRGTSCYIMVGLDGPPSLDDFFRAEF